MRFRRWIVAAAISAMCATGCGSDESREHESGALSMQLELPAGVTVAEITYQITGNGIVPISSIVDTSGPGTTFSFSVSVPAGQGYLLALSALSTNGERNCAGSAPFDITAGQTTVVQVGLNCARTGTVQVNGEGNLCVELLDPVFSALEAPIGATIDFGVLALDLENDPIEFLWAASNGTLSDPAASTTTYTCDAVGKHTVSVIVSDDGFDVCVEQWSTVVTCGDLATCTDEGQPCVAGPCEDAVIACVAGQPVCGGTGPAGAGLQCRASAGVCDVAEFCNGSSVDCPPDGSQPSTVICRASVGDCDEAETCAGSDPACPVDGFEPSGTSCGGGTCDGAGVCEALSLEPMTTVTSAGGSVQFTVTSAVSAPPGGSDVSVTYVGGGSGPAFVSILEGQTTASFDFVAGASGTISTVTVFLGSDSDSATVTVVD